MLLTLIVFFGFLFKLNSQSIICKKMGDQIVVQQHYQPYYISMPLNNPEVGISNSAMAIANNNVTCSFTRTNEQSGVETYYNFKDSNVNNIYLLAAYGSGKLCLRKYDNILHNSFQCFFYFYNFNLRYV